MPTLLPKIPKTLRVVTSPFCQGLKKVDAIALLMATRAPEGRLQRLYHKTAHFQALKAVAYELYGGCAICGRDDDQAGLTFHHTSYRNLFNEDVAKDGLLVCRKCHRKLHGKG
jgi:hypothetical protein